MLLAPLGWLVCRVAARRRARARSAPPARLAVPVVVVGNLTVGGTGKTPVLMALAEQLRARGHRIGIVSRGYGAEIGPVPRNVAQADSAASVGDEPWLVHRQTGCPVMVHPERLLAARQLLKHYPETTLILSDDGLQHHHLPRQLEIVVVDGVRRFGNQRCLPAGPLREPLSTLALMDFVVVNGARFAEDQWPVRFELDGARDLVTGEWLGLKSFHARQVQSLAGIGNPDRFFAALAEQGIEITPHRLDDHQSARATLRAHLLASGQPILMTTKDAVKWSREGLEPGQAYAVEGHARLPDGLADAIVDRLATVTGSFDDAEVR